MKLEPKEFKVTLSVEGNKFRVDLEEGGEQRAMLSEDLQGHWSIDHSKIKNFRDTIVELILERFCPNLCWPLTDGGVADVTELAKRKAAYEKEFLAGSAGGTGREV